MNVIKIFRWLACSVIIASATLFMTASHSQPTQTAKPTGTSRSTESSKPPLKNYFHGVWVNQYGSILDLKERDGMLTGQFTSMVGKTRSCIGMPVTIQGATNRNAMSISLSMASCGSPVVIAMTGNLTKEKNGKDQLRVQGLVQYYGKDTWDSQILTSNLFTRQVNNNNKNDSEMP